MFGLLKNLLAKGADALLLVSLAVNVTLLGLALTAGSQLVYNQGVVGELRKANQGLEEKVSELRYSVVALTAKTENALIPEATVLEAAKVHIVEPVSDAVHSASSYVSNKAKAFWLYVSS